MGQEAGRGANAERSTPAGTTGVTVMTMTERKVIKAKVGLLELAKQLGSVTQACRVKGYSLASAISTRRVVIWRWLRSPARSPI